MHPFECSFVGSNIPDRCVFLAPLSAAAALRARRQQAISESSGTAPREESLGEAAGAKTSSKSRVRKKSKDKAKSAENGQDASSSVGATAPIAEALGKAPGKRPVDSTAHVPKPLSAVEARRAALEEQAKLLVLKDADDSDNSVDSYEPDYLPRPSDEAETGFQNDSRNQASGDTWNAVYAAPSVEVSSWTPSLENVSKHNSNGMTVRLAPGQTLASVGMYDVLVKRGVVTLYGAILRAGPHAMFYRVFAPATHALPVLQCLSPGGAEVELKSITSQLPLMERLSPLYGRLWKAEESVDQSFLRNQKKRWSFENIHVLSDDSLGRPLYHLEMPPEWHKAIDKICSAASKRKSNLFEKILVCGPKSSGKSTFSRFLLNRLFTIDREAMKSESHSVFLLDIDPGQPEYGPPGQISLIELRLPFFGPPFAHPSATTGTHQRTVRAHFIGANSPKDNPEHFVECAIDLATAYHKHLNFGNTRGPLIINCPGWTIGTGLQILLSLLSRLSPTDLIFTSDEPSRALEALTTAATTTSATTVQRFQPIPSQPSGHPSRSPADFRTMQALSYFHLATPRQNDSHQAWDATPLTQLRPYVVSYASSSPDFLAVLATGDAVAPTHLPTVLNGAIVGVVELSPSSTTTSAIADTDDTNDSTFASRVAHSPAPHHIPYIAAPRRNRRTLEPPSPQTSRLVTLALVRGIDAPNQALHLLVPPANEHLLDELRDPRRTLLVLGALDVPAWAYLEDVQMDEWARRERDRKGAAAAAGGGSEVDVGRVPWVHRESGASEAGVGVMGAKRRLRRFVG
ncbi:uncharacterized protein J3D65DRAFT_688401 [Phyllosticta citribraziliensis]|uniref:Polynucleotide 5'-hydroxyl-kinase GRC3 n=1 Tax=Phyllosticta citribraziliensis TaxID=989973 RepID=A0ABR1L556_9PEZI